MRSPKSPVRLTSAWFRYGIAFTVLIPTLGMQWLVNDYVGNKFAVAFLFLAIMFVSWVGGFTPALITSVVGVYTMGAVFPPPASQDDGNLAGIALYFLIAFGMALFGAGMSRARRRAEVAAEKLQNLAARLSEADRRKDAFLATLAHELRNPLAPISTALDVMKLMGDLPEHIEEIRSMMQRQTQQLVTIVDDLLDVSRITRGKFELRKCDVKLQEVILSAVEAASPVIHDRHHQLTLNVPDEPIYLHGDPHRLAQVFSNLLNNAAKYTPIRGHITLHAACNGGTGIVTVQDDGIGIAVDSQEKVFEMFGQLEHPLQKGTSGLGIGLTLVKSLVEMHDGKVSVRSQGADMGSEFIVELPILAEIPHKDWAGQRVESLPETSTPCRVLVADDNQAAVEMLSVALRTLGNEVCTARDGQEAIEVAERLRPNIIFMDLGMPRMNGYQAARHIRDQAWGKSIVLVAITGWGMESDRNRSREAGYDHHLIKPAQLADVQRVLGELKIPAK